MEHIINLPTQHNTHCNFRYVDNILNIYDSWKTGTNTTLVDFNHIHPNLWFTSETETDNIITFISPSKDFKIVYTSICTGNLPSLTPLSPLPPAILRYLYICLNTYCLNTSTKC